jgi:hypothetical protein
MQIGGVGPRICTAQRTHHRLFVIGLLVLEVDFRIERAGEIGRQIAGILRPNRNAGPKGAALACKVPQMGTTSRRRLG